MSIQSEINRIKNNLAAAYTAASEKGATMPSQQNSANLASTISSVSTAGGSSSRGFAVTVTGGTIEDMTFTANFTPREVLEAVLATENYSDLDITVSIGSAISDYKNEIAIFRLKEFRQAQYTQGVAGYAMFRGEFSQQSGADSGKLRTHELYLNAVTLSTLKVVQHV